MDHTGLRSTPLRQILLCHLSISFDYLYFDKLHKKDTYKAIYPDNHVKNIKRAVLWEGDSKKKFN